MMRILFIVLLTLTTVLTASAWRLSCREIGSQGTTSGSLTSGWFGLYGAGSTLQVAIGWRLSSRPAPANTWSAGWSILGIRSADSDRPVPRRVIFVHADLWWLTGCTLLLWCGLLLSWVVHERRRTRGKRSLCIGCGYDLTGNESGICPECGQEVHGVSECTAVSVRVSRDGQSCARVILWKQMISVGAIVVTVGAAVFLVVNGQSPVHYGPKSITGLRERPDGRARSVEELLAQGDALLVEADKTPSANAALNLVVWAYNVFLEVQKRPAATKSDLVRSRLGLGNAEMLSAEIRRDNLLGRLAP